MSGIEIFVIVGGAIYIANKVKKKKKEKKRLEREAASGLESGHARATVMTTTPDENNQSSGLRQQVPVREEEPLPVYKAPTVPPSSNTTGMRWSESIHLPTYDELPESQPGKEFAVDGEKRENGNETLESTSPLTPLASPLSPVSAHTSYLTPPKSNGSSRDTSDKRRRFWRRSSSSKAPGT